MTAHIPQKRKSIAIAIISRLSCDLLLLIKSFITKPKTHPSSKTPIFVISGITTSLALNTAPEIRETATETATL